MVAQLLVTPCRAPLQGSVPLPVDEQIVLARLALAALSHGESSLQHSGETGALRVLLDALELLGVSAQREARLCKVRGRGLLELDAPEAVLDVRGEAQVAALLVGLLVGRPFASELWVDPILAETLLPLLQSWLTWEPREPGVLVRIFPQTERLPGQSLRLSGVFPWEKQALLLIALRAGQAWELEEQWTSADHLERALLHVQAPLETQGGRMTLHPPRDEDALLAQEWETPGSAVLVPYLASLALALPGSAVELRGVSTNPTRASFLQITRILGARTGLSPRNHLQGEPLGDVSFYGGQLRATELSGEMMIRLGDAALPLAVVLARSQGRVVLSDLVSHERDASPRVFSRLVGFLRMCGVEAQLGAEGVLLEGTGGRPFRAFEVTTGGDARLALLGSLLGLLSEGTCIVDDVECLRESFPRWVGTLRALGAQVEVRTV